MDDKMTVEITGFDAESIQKMLLREQQLMHICHYPCPLPCPTHA